MTLILCVFCSLRVWIGACDESLTPLGYYDRVPVRRGRIPPTDFLRKALAVLYKDLERFQLGKIVQCPLCCL